MTDWMEPEMTADGLAADSCLLTDMSGLTDATPLSAEQVVEALAQTAIDSVTDEMLDAVGLPFADAVAQPQFYRVMQCRGATAMARGKHNISSIILHTPEGYESGTLSVLSGTRAGFDFYLPPNGRLYKCNDYLRYFSWQAGDLRYNQNSVGIEQWDFASRMNQAGDDHYGRLGRLCAYLVETLDLRIQYAPSYGGYGFIFHRTVTPGARCDPDNCAKSRFDTDKLLDIVSDLVKGKPDPTKPTPKPGDGLTRLRLAEDYAKGRQVGAYRTVAALEADEKILERFGLKTTLEKA